VISAAVTDLIAGKLDTNLHLNVLEAANGRLKEADQKVLLEYQTTLAKSEPLAKWIACLDGGDVEAGRKLFFEKTELSCVRCHKVDRTGGEVGPNLTTIGKDKDARYLLESICLPDAQVAKGFETTNVVDIDGRVLAGIVRQENDDFIELMLPDGKLERVLQDDIEVRKKGKSAMPQDLIKHLNDRELRDLVAYLKSLKKSRRGASEVE
jgi:quinoprotein glucose dehydrogenase